MLEDLEERRPNPLHPVDPLNRAEHRAWIELGSSLLNAGRVTSRRISRRRDMPRSCAAPLGDPLRQSSLFYLAYSHWQSSVLGMARQLLEPW